MKRPDCLGDITLDTAPYRNAHKPMGFYSLHVCELGNGDQFGLYWPIGREDYPPIVCETYHDEGAIVPVFSSADAFAACAKAHDHNWFDASDRASKDPLAPHSLYEKARSLQAPDTVAESLAILESLELAFSEYGVANSLRAKIQWRLKRHEAAVQSLMAAIIAPPCFGGADRQIVSLWKALDSAPDIIRNNPLYSRRAELDWSFGGTKTNDSYAVLLEALTYFEDIGDYVAASSLAQAYAQRMSAETGAFRERYGFEQAAFTARQKRLASLLPFGTRELAQSPSQA